MIPQNVINMLSAKGKGYVEAAMKIAHGQQLVEEGTIEIAALDGRKLGTNHNAGGVDVISTVRDLARPKVAPTAETSHLRKRPTVMNRTTRRPSPKKGQRQTGKVAARNMNLRQPNAKAEAENRALVLKGLAAKPGQTIGPLMRSIKRSYYPVARAIAALLKDGKIREKTVLSKNDRELTTWEIVGGA